MEEEVSRNSMQPGELGAYRISSETTPLQSVKTGDEGLKYIITTFGVVSVLLTIALAVTIGQQASLLGFGAGVVSDREVCTSIGRDLLQSGGNAVDAAIAVTFCLGVVLPHLTGIGGNGLILVYNQRSGKPLLCLDSWERRKEAAMSGARRPLGGAPPRLLAALYRAHQAAGKLPWPRLLEPSVKLARDGFAVSESLVQSKGHLNSSVASQNLMSWLSALQVGANITAPQLAASLSLIHTQGPNGFYKGKLSSELIEFYREFWESEYSILKDSTCLSYKVGGYSVTSSGLGSGGPFLQSALTSLVGTNLSLYQLIDFLKDKEEMNWPLPGGVVVAASDQMDTYVSIVSGLGPVLGSQVLSENGYILGSRLVGLSPSLDSSGVTAVIADLTSPCNRRTITGSADARDLLEVLRGLLLWRGDSTLTEEEGADDEEKLQTLIEAPRVRFTSSGPQEERDHGPSLTAPRLLTTAPSLPPAPLPYPTINLLHLSGDTLLTVSDSRSGL